MLLDERQDYPLLRAIEEHIFVLGRNYILFVIGMPQTAKSTNVAQMCHAWSFKMGLDPTFDFKERFSMGNSKRFIDIADMNLKRGNIIGMEEGGKGLDAQLWYEQIQKDIKHIIHTFGEQGLFFIITAVTKDINNKIMPLVMGELEMKYLNRSQGISWGIFRIPNYDQNKKKVVNYKLPRMITRSGRIRVMNKITFRKPPQHIIDDYMSWSVPLKRELIREKKTNYELEEKRKRKYNFDPIKSSKEILETPEDFIKEWQNKKLWNRGKIMSRFDVGRTNAEKVIGELPDPEQYHI